MKLNDQLKSKLSKVYQPSAMIEMTFKGKDIAFKTNEEGQAVLLFIGRKDISGVIKGERYVRILKRDQNGLVIKDHWDLKGKAS